MVPNGILKQGVVAEFNQLQNNIYNFKDSLKSKETNEKKENVIFAAYKLASEMLPNVNYNQKSIYKKVSPFILTIRANPMFGLPFGLPSKLLFLSILNELNITKSPVLRLGKICLKLCANVTLLNEKKFLQDQMLRLFSSQISCVYDNEDQIMEFDFWWNPLKGKKENISASSTIVLTKELYYGLLKYNKTI